MLLEQLDLLDPKVQRATRVTQEIQDQREPQAYKVQQDQRAIQVIPDLLARLDRLVQLALLDLKATLVTLGLKVLPERLDLLAKLVRLGLLVLLAHKVKKATKGTRAILATQVQQVLLVPQDQLDPKAQQDQQDQQVQRELLAQRERLGLKVHRE